MNILCSHAHISNKLCWEYLTECSEIDIEINLKGDRGKEIILYYMIYWFEYEEYINNKNSEWYQ